MKAKVDVHRSRLDGQVLQIAHTPALPRFIRIRDASGYLGMDKNRFNREVRPYLNEIPTGTQGIAFDRIDLDALADEYKRRLKSPTPALLIHSLTKEQTVLLKELPAHLAKMVLFKVNTGCREQGGVWP